MISITEHSINRELEFDIACLRRRLCFAESLIDELSRENDRLLHLSKIDDLTVLGNRRHFRELLEDAARFATQDGGLLSLILIDVDRFKQFNDTFGHRAGDQVLVGLADILRSVITDQDLLARYGGEEFTVLLPAAGEDESLTIAECIRRSVETHPWPLHSVTVSLGVATMPGEALSSVELIQAADRALYASKEAGRNLVYHSRSMTGPAIRS